MRHGRPQSLPGWSGGAQAAICRHQLQIARRLSCRLLLEARQHWQHTTVAAIDQTCHRWPCCTAVKHMAAKTAPGIPSHPAQQALQGLTTLGLATALACALALPAGALQHSATRSAPGLPAAPAVSEAAAPLRTRLQETLLQALRHIEQSVDSTVARVTSTFDGRRGEAEADPEARATASAAAAELIDEVWEVVRDNYLDARSGGFSLDRWRQLRDEALAAKPSDSAAAHSAIRDMLSKAMGSDPFTRFVSADAFQAMRKYDVTGVGLNLGTADDYVRKTGRPLPAGRQDEHEGVWVLGMMRGTAADTAGVQPGDELLRVNGSDVSARDPFKVATLIGTPDEADPEAPLTLEVRKPAGDVMTAELVRPVQRIPSPVSSSLEERGNRKVATIRLSAFNARAETDIIAAISGLQAEGATEFVLDLRDNLGGLVTEGIALARLFLPEGATVVTTAGSPAVGGQVVKAQTAPLTPAPLTVLVDGNSASASEIFAGALRDNCRAVLVGKRTYGKGLIQSVYELGDGSGLVLTVGKYLTPDGIDIDREGLQPDFRRQPAPDAAEEVLHACRVNHGRSG